jgi:hypothetical protein
MFGRNSESRLVRQYSAGAMTQLRQYPISKSQAQGIVEHCIKDARANTASNGLGLKEGEDLVSLYLSGSEADTPYGIFWLSIIRKYRPFRDADGVTDFDMIQFWHRSHFERELICVMPNVMRMAIGVIIGESRPWGNLEEMMKKISFECDLNAASFGLIEESKLDLTDPTRALPIELFARVQAYCAIPWNPITKFKLEKHGNMNAFLREEISLGNL